MCLLEAIVYSSVPPKRCAMHFVEVEMAIVSANRQTLLLGSFSEDIVRKTSRLEFWEIPSVETVKNVFFA